MTLRQALRITRELLDDNADHTSTMHPVLSPERADALRRLADHAQNSVSIGDRIPRGARLSPIRGPKP